ncbi:protein NEDD1 isoform X1 [Synchiropus splendidus]|uniref:protein NEDD1 isoform X1 n=1 Tax=Synchiropus splendidus TaxID=270530 RepID=UPI00237E9286|nr:protein NEDD1 isoform X1 [Synchiropus splendidus]
MEEVTRLVSTGDCLKIWDGVSMAVVEQFNPHSASHTVSQACWSSNNQYVVSASSGGDKVVVSSLKASPVPVVELAQGLKQTRVSLSSSSQYLVSGGLDHSVHIWDLKTKRLHRSLQDHSDDVTCVSFNSTDSSVASGSSSGDIVLHSLTTNMSSKPFGLGSQEPVHDLRLSPLKRSLLASVCDSGAVVLWDANTQKELHAFHTAHKAPGSGVVFSPASELLLASVGLDKKIVCYDTSSKILLRAIRVDSPLTSVDFTLDGTGLVVGSTQGKIYQYDLRNSSAPTKVTLAHKTSVTSLRFQSQATRRKSGKVGPTKMSVKRPVKLSGSLQDVAPGSALTPSSEQMRSITEAAAGTCSEAAGLQGAELPSVERFNNVGKNSLDFFSPAREDARNSALMSETSLGRKPVSSLEMLSREGEGLPLTGRSSLDVFSPVRDESQSFGRVPLAVSAGRCYSPLSVLHTSLIKEEQPVVAAVEGGDAGQVLTSTSSLEATPPSTQQSSQNQPAPPFFTPEPSLRRANGIQAQLSYDSPATRSPHLNSSAPGPVMSQCPGATSVPSSSSSSTAVSTSLSNNIAEAGGQGAAPLTSLQIPFIQNMIQETLDDLRDSCHRDIINLQVEMIRQFCIQMEEIHSMVQKYSVNDALLEEIERLREENRRLRANY